MTKRQNTRPARSVRYSNGDAVINTRYAHLGTGVVVDFVDGRRNYMQVSWENGDTFATYTGDLQLV